MRSSSDRPPPSRSSDSSGRCAAPSPSSSTSLTLRVVRRAARAKRRAGRAKHHPRGPRAAGASRRRSRRHRAAAGARPGLDAVHRRLLRHYRDDPDILASEIAGRVVAGIHGLDLARVSRIAATLIRNCERDIVRVSGGVRRRRRDTARSTRRRCPDRARPRCSACRTVLMRRRRGPPD